MRKCLEALLSGLLLIGWLIAHAQDGGGEAGPQYVPLESVLVNLDGRRRYLRADIELLVEGAEPAEKINAHMPVIRHALIMLLSGRNPDEVVTVEEREKLRQQAREALRTALAPYMAAEGLQDLFFTNFMIQ